MSDQPITEPVKIYCNKCAGMYALPHECGRDQPVDLRAPKDPDARPQAGFIDEAVNWTAEDWRNVRAELERYDARTAALLAITSDMAEMVKGPPGQKVRQAVRRGMVTAKQALAMFAAALESDDAG